MTIVLDGCGYLVWCSWERGAECLYHGSRPLSARYAQTTSGALFSSSFFFQTVWPLRIAATSSDQATQLESSSLSHPLLSWHRLRADWELCVPGTWGWGRMPACCPFRVYLLDEILALTLNRIDEATGEAFCTARLYKAA